MTAPICPKCRTPTRLTRGAEVYPHRLDLREKPFWLCDGCGAFCGCHPNTTRPLGSPADAETRNLRQRVHALLDPKWRLARFRGEARSRAYAELGTALGLKSSDCHVGMFDAATCRQAIGFLLLSPTRSEAACARHESAAK